MNISFTGFKNPTSMQRVLAVKDTKQCLSQSTFLNLELTDDKFGDDFTMFKNAMEKSGENYINIYNPKFLNIESSIDYKDNIKFILNGRPLEVEDRNMSLFTYLANLTNKIKTTTCLKHFCVEQKCFESPEYLKSFVSVLTNGQDLSGSFKKFTEMTALPEVTKAGANIINEVIQKKMNKFFNVLV